MLFENMFLSTTHSYKLSEFICSINKINIRSMSELNIKYLRFQYFSKTAFLIAISVNFVMYVIY